MGSIFCFMNRRQNFAMYYLIGIFLLSLLSLSAYAQFTVTTYPDPRADPLGCKLFLPGYVCDPDEILSSDDRQSLNSKIQQLQSITSSIKNTSPACQENNESSNLKIIVALLDKLGASLNSLDIEKFTNGLRQRYMNFQDIGMCDTLVLIVNSRLDRQVFTVAGRDARLSRDVLQAAFQKNIAHFRAGRYINGLEGMIKYVVTAYHSTHIMNVPSSSNIKDINAIESIQPVESSLSSFITSGVRHKPETTVEPFSFDDIAEQDKLWVELLIKAVNRCGNDPTMIATHLRAIVEESMTISLKLLADTRYNKIEEEAQDFSAGANARAKAWQDASRSFINDLYTKYGDRLPNGQNQCPEVEETKSPTLLW